LADGRPIRLGDRACDVLTALIEASGAVVSKDKLSSRVRQGSIVDQNRHAGIKTATLRKGSSADRELMPLAADGFASSPARSPPSPGMARRSPQRRVLAEFADEGSTARS